MNSDLLAVAAVTLTATTIVCAVGWVTTYVARVRAQERLWALSAAHGYPADAVTGDVPAIGVTAQQKLAQLQSQVDTMGQQLERIAESQEFFSRMLVDRIDQLPDPRMRTPH